MSNVSASTIIIARSGVADSSVVRTRRNIPFVVAADFPEQRGPPALSAVHAQLGLMAEYALGSVPERRVFEDAWDALVV